MDNWPASKIVLRPVKELKDAAQNSRVHSDEQISQIASSIEEFGWTIPVLVDEEGTLIAGHARVQAAHKLGLTEVPVMVADGWSDAKKEAYQIADNRLAENSEWDMTILNDQMKRLASEAFDLDLLGFDLEDFDLGGAFNPTLDPTTTGKSVSDGDVDKAKDSIEKRFADGERAETYEVVCPHCGETFEVQL